MQNCILYIQDKTTMKTIPLFTVESDSASKLDIEQARDFVVKSPFYAEAERKEILESLKGMTNGDSWKESGFPYGLPVDSDNYPVLYYFVKTENFSMDNEETAVEAEEVQTEHEVITQEESHDEESSTNDSSEAEDATTDPEPEAEEETESVEPIGEEVQQLLVSHQQEAVEFAAIALAALRKLNNPQTSLTESIERFKTRGLASLSDSIQDELDKCSLPQVSDEGFEMVDIPVNREAMDSGETEESNDSVEEVQENEDDLADILNF